MSSLEEEEVEGEGEEETKEERMNRLRKEVRQRQLVKDFATKMGKKKKKSRVPFYLTSTRKRKKKKRTTPVSKVIDDFLTRYIPVVQKVYPLVGKKHEPEAIKLLQELIKMENGEESIFDTPNQLTDAVFKILLKDTNIPFTKFQHIYTKHYTGQRMLTIEAIRRDPIALKLADKELRKDIDVVREAVKEHGKETLIFAHKDLQDNKWLQLEGFVVSHAKLLKKVGMNIKTLIVYIRKNVKIMKKRNFITMFDGMRFIQMMKSYSMLIEQMNRWQKLMAQLEVTKMQLYTLYTRVGDAIDDATDVEQWKPGALGAPTLFFPYSKLSHQFTKETFGEKKKMGLMKDMNDRITKNCYPYVPKLIEPKVFQAVANEELMMFGGLRKIGAFVEKIDKTILSWKKYSKTLIKLYEGIKKILLLIWNYGGIMFDAYVAYLTYYKATEYPTLAQDDYPISQKRHVYYNILTGTVVIVGRRFVSKVIRSLPAFVASSQAALVNFIGDYNLDKMDDTLAGLEYYIENVDVLPKLVEVSIPQQDQPKTWFQYATNWIPKLRTLIELPDTLYIGTSEQQQQQQQHSPECIKRWKNLVDNKFLSVTNKKLKIDNGEYKNVFDMMTGLKSIEEVNDKEKKAFTILRGFVTDRDLQYVSLSPELKIKDHSHFAGISSRMDFHFQRPESVELYRGEYGRDFF